LEENLKRIASRIRSWRDESGLTLQKLGDRSGVSASTIHKIENLQTVPTIAVLLKVLNGLNRRPSELLEDVDVEKQIAIVRHQDRRRLSMSDNAEAENLIGMIPHNRLDMWRVFLESGRGAGRPGTAPWQFVGEIVVLVEEGCVEVEVGGASYEIEAGDSIHFDSSLPHRWFATRGASARLMAIAIIPENLQADILSRTAAAAAANTERVEAAGVEQVETS